MKKNNRGFTLAELLIVVAIIAVLVAIAIPIFNGQLEKAREATDVANARDAYAEIAVALIDGSLDNDNKNLTISGGLSATYAPPAGEATTSTVTISSFPIKQTIAGWVSDHNVAGVTVTGNPTKDNATLIFTFTTATRNNGSSNTYLSAVAFS